jgi:hypothetical protein
MSEARFYVDYVPTWRSDREPGYTVCDRQGEKEPVKARGHGSAAAIARKMNEDWRRYQDAMLELAQSKPTARAGDRS